MKRWFKVLWCSMFHKEELLVSTYSKTMFWCRKCKRVTSEIKNDV